MIMTFLSKGYSIVVCIQMYDQYLFFMMSFVPAMVKDLSRHMGKPTICIGENKAADQLRSNCEADQLLCFRYIFYLNPKFQSVLVQVGLCRTCSETTLLVFPRGGSFV